MQMYNCMRAHSGFSLVELSIVLVILGLLTGGILSGQALIRAAELRSVNSQFQTYQAAIFSFRDRYMALAGDMSMATRFWGFDDTAPSCTNRTGAANAGTAGTCDGNGDGQLATVPAGGSGERTEFWRHLARAGLIEGSYTGLAGPTNSSHAILGENVPRARISSVGWWASTITGTGSASFTRPIHNMLVVGALTTTPVNNLSAPFLKPEEAWNLDTKLDDGRPAYGKIVGRNISTCTTTSDPSNFSAEYLLSSSAIGCALNFIDFF